MKVRVIFYSPGIDIKDNLESDLIIYLRENQESQIPKSLLKRLMECIEISICSGTMIYEFNFDVGFLEEETDLAEEVLIEFSEKASKKYEIQVRFHINRGELYVDSRGEYFLGKYVYADETFVLQNGYFPIDSEDEPNLDEFSPTKNVGDDLIVYFYIDLTGLGWLNEVVGAEGRVISDTVNSVQKLYEAIAVEPILFSKCTRYLFSVLCNNDYFARVCGREESMLGPKVSTDDLVVLTDITEIETSSIGLSAKLHIDAKPSDFLSVAKSIDSVVSMYNELLGEIDSCGYRIQMFTVFPMINSKTETLFYSSYGAGSTTEGFGVCKRTCAKYKLKL